jgi:GMP synthase (glutamine-hydrolysing)
VPIEDPDDPSIASTDLVILLGGPLGAYHTPAVALLSKEIALLERRSASGRPTLGICLGSQLMASALLVPEYSRATQRSPECAPSTQEGSASCLPIGLRAPGGLL